MIVTRADFFAGRGPGARWIGSITPTHEPPRLREKFALAEGDPTSANNGSPYVVTDFMDEVEEILAEHESEWAGFLSPVRVWLPGDADRPSQPDAVTWAYCFDAGAVYVHLDGYLIEVLYPNGSRKRAELPDITKESNGPRPAAG